jgi:DNA invertase Pin-like site-specific DNA recombinase
MGEENPVKKQRVSKLSLFDRAVTQPPKLGPWSVGIPCRNRLYFRQIFDRAIVATWGYWRTSTTEQQSERQEQSLREAGCERIYGDQITGTSAYGERPELSKCLDGLRDGDTLVIHELDRLGRSMVEMLVQVNGLIERGVAIKTLDGRLDTASMPEELVKLVVGVMGYAAEMELKSIKKRTAEGREVAKSRGVKFGRKRSYTPQQAAAVMEMRQRGDGYGTIASAMGMTDSMVRRIIQQQKLS